MSLQATIGKPELISHLVEAITRRSFALGALVAGLPSRVLAAKQTQAGIVYATGSKVVRSIVLTDDDSQLAPHQKSLLPGESFLIVPHVRGRDVLDLEVAEAAVQKATGVVPPRLVCALVDKSATTVDNLIHADPAIDTHPTHNVILAAPGVHVNWKYDGTQFLARYVTVAKATNIVQSITWAPTSKPPAATALLVPVENATANIGDKVFPPTVVNVPSTGTVPF